MYSIYYKIGSNKTGWPTYYLTRCWMFLFIKKMTRTRHTEFLKFYKDIQGLPKRSLLQNNASIFGMDPAFHPGKIHIESKSGGLQDDFPFPCEWIFQGVWSHLNLFNHCPPTSIIHHPEGRHTISLNEHHDSYQLRRLISGWWLQWLLWVFLNLDLVGGWTNPLEKYDRQNGIIFPK